MTQASNPPEHVSVEPSYSRKRVFLMVGTSKDDEAASDMMRTISRHSLAYMLCAASEMFRHYDFDPIDLMIIHAILNANVLKIMKNPELDRRFGSERHLAQGPPARLEPTRARPAARRLLGRLALSG